MSFKDFASASMDMLFNGGLTSNLRASKRNMEMRASRGSKGQAWVFGVVAGVIGIVIAATVLFSLIPTIKTQIATANLTGAESSLAGLVTLVIIAGFLLLVLGVFLAYKMK